MTFPNSTSRSGVLSALGLAAFTFACAAPTTTTTSEEDAAAAGRSARSSTPMAPDAPGGDSRTMQMLLDLQSSRAPLEGGERIRVAPSSATPAPAATRPAEPAAPATPPQNPFSRALEIGKPAVSRELRSPTTADPSSTNPVGRPTTAEGGSRAERHGDGATAETERALREKLGGQIPLPVALIRYIRENRTTVLLFSLASLGLVGWVAARATQRPN